ncbi:MAG: hypothetical protein KAR54_02685 [Candidatus Pacebacteria bacterium]|nr:hypothetical protein [Candidatus Paceibacterota bacterium]
MKRKTCKILIWIGILFILSPIIVVIGFLGYFIRSQTLPSLAILFTKLLFWAIVLFIIALWGWNSEERKAGKKEIKDLQLEILRQSVKKGKTKVELKGKMRKLK